MEKIIYEINEDGIYSTIEETTLIGVMGERKVDEICYFSTKEKAKKALLKDLKNSIEDYKVAIKRIKENY
jgi:hypothetical protein